MEGVMGKRRIPVFYRVLFIFIAVITPLFALSIIVNLNGQEDVKREIAQSMRARIDFYISTLDGEIKNIIKLQADLMANEDLRKLASDSQLADDFEKYKLVNNVRSKLLSMKQLSRYVGEASVYIPLINMKVTTGVLGDIPWDEYNHMKKLTISNYYRTARWGNGYFINIASNHVDPIRSTNVEPMFIISIRLASQSIEGDLAQLSNEGSGGAALISSNSYGLNLLAGGQFVFNKEILPHLKSFLAKNPVKEGMCGVGNLTAQGQPYIVAYGKSRMLETALIAYVPEHKLLSSLRRYKIWIWVLSAITLIIVAFFSLWLKNWISKPLEKMVNTFRKVEKGNLDISVSYHGNDEFGYLYSQFNQLFQKLKQLIKQDYEHNILMRNAELKQLQYQINPHFLYNSLLIVNGLITMSDYECAQKLSQHLGSYYRYITRNSSDEVPLSREIKHALDYIEIQCIRFFNRVETQIGELPVELEEVPVPRLIVQPVVENSFNHGLKDKLQEGLLKLYYRINQQGFGIFVEDNGTEITDEKIIELSENLHSEQPGLERTGLMNVHRRLCILYGNESGVFLSRGQAGGLCVEIRIVRNINERGGDPSC